MWVLEDADLKKRLLKEFYNSLIAGHFRRDRIVLVIKRLLFWRGIDTDMDDFIGSYLVYQRNKPLRT